MLFFIDFNVLCYMLHLCYICATFVVCLDIVKSFLYVQMWISGDPISELDGEDDLGPRVKHCVRGEGQGVCGDRN